MAQVSNPPLDEAPPSSVEGGEAEAAATFPVAASGIAGRLPDPQGATVEVPNLCADRPGEARAGREAAHPWRVHRPRRSAGRAHRGAAEESEEREVPGQDPHGRRVCRALGDELAAGRFHDQGVSEDNPQPHHPGPGPHQDRHAHRNPHRLPLPGTRKERAQGRIRQGQTPLGQQHPQGACRARRDPRRRNRRRADPSSTRRRRSAP